MSDPRFVLRLAKSVMGIAPTSISKNASVDFNANNMLLVHAHIEFLQVTDLRTDMRHFIDGDRFAQCCATGQNSHQSEKNNGEDMGKAHHSGSYESAQSMVSVSSTEAAWARRKTPRLGDSGIL
jgi:hypothetical protein